MNATVMDEIGTPLKTRQHRLGHAQIATAMTHYTHKVDADDREAADTIGAMLSPVVELVNLRGNFGPRVGPIKRWSRNWLFYKLLIQVNLIGCGGWI